MTGRGWVLNPKQTNKVKLFYFIELTVYQEERLQELLAKSRLGSGGQEDGTGGLDGRGGRAVQEHRLGQGEENRDWDGTVLCSLTLLCGGKSCARHQGLPEPAAAEGVRPAVLHHTLLEIFSYRLHQIQAHYRLSLLTHLHQLAAHFILNNHAHISFTEELNRVVILTLDRAVHIGRMEQNGSTWLKEVVASIMAATPHSWPSQTVASFPAVLKERKSWPSIPDPRTTWSGSRSRRGGVEVIIHIVSRSII